MFATWSQKPRLEAVPTDQCWMKAPAGRQGARHWPSLVCSWNSCTMSVFSDAAIMQACINSSGCLVERSCIPCRKRGFFEHTTNCSTVHCLRFGGATLPFRTIDLQECLASSASKHPPCAPSFSFTTLLYAQLVQQPRRIGFNVCFGMPSMHSISAGLMDHIRMLTTKHRPLGGTPCPPRRIPTLTRRNCRPPTWTSCDVPINLCQRTKRKEEATQQGHGRSDW